MSKKESFFWTSFSDLMTSLFFVMLLLVVVSITVVEHSNKVNNAKLQQEKLRADSLRMVSEKQLNRIKELNQAIKNIDTKHFEYNEKTRKHTIKDVKAEFHNQSHDIKDIGDDDKNKLIEAGRAIQEFLKESNKKYEAEKRTNPKAVNPQYLIIIEGHTSKDNFINNDNLSYRRALALVKLWEENNINLRNANEYKNCELLIAGSGQSGKDRIAPDDRENTSNRRFVIHIIAKPGGLIDE